MGVAPRGLAVLACSDVGSAKARRGICGKQSLVGPFPSTLRLRYLHAMVHLGFVGKLGRGGFLESIVGHGNEDGIAFAHFDSVMTDEDAAAAGPVENSLPVVPMVVGDDAQAVWRVSTTNIQVSSEIP